MVTLSPDKQDPLTSRPSRLRSGSGHSFIERELTKGGIGFRKDDNAFLAADDVAALQAAADRLSPQIIRKQLDLPDLHSGTEVFKEGTQPAPTPTPRSPKAKPS